jgi:hypothetical protein
LYVYILISIYMHAYMCIIIIWMYVICHWEKQHWKIEKLKWKAYTLISALIEDILSYYYCFLSVFPNFILSQIWSKWCNKWYVLKILFLCSWYSTCINLLLNTFIMLVYRMRIYKLCIFLYRERYFINHYICRI